MRICNFTYSNIAKPLLFLISPDQAHHAMIILTSFLGRLGFVRALVKMLFYIKPAESLKQNLNGIDFNSPVGLSAGFDKNGEIMPMVSRLGFGFGTVGSVTAKVCSGNPKPWFYRLPKSKSLVVNAGLANHGAKVIINRLRGYNKRELKTDFPIVLSVAKTNSRLVVSISDGIGDYLSTIKQARKISCIKLIELNISCPNAYGGEPFTTPSRLRQLLKAVMSTKPSQPITIKMPIDLEWGDFKQLLDVAVAYNVRFVTISNLYKDRRSAHLKDVLPDSVKGNLSGRPTWEKSNFLIRKTYLEYNDKLTIIGVGGIFNANDAYKKIRFGASLVEIITGVIFCGPQLASEITSDLGLLLKNDGFSHINQAVGIDAKKRLK